MSPSRRRTTPRSLRSPRPAPRRTGWQASPAVVAIAAVALIGVGALGAGLVFLVGGLGGPGGTPTSSGPTGLPAGTYRSQLFQPQVTFTLPRGWAITADTADYFSIQPAGNEQVGIHLFRDPLALSQDAACPETAQPGVGSLSSELAAWIRGLPGLTVSNPRLANIGGLRGTEFDVQIAAGWTASCSFANGLPTVPLFLSQGGGYRWWIVAGSERLRLALLEVPGGGTVVVDVDAFDGTLMDALVAEAAPIVQTFSFSTLSPQPSASPAPPASLPVASPSGAAPSASP
jgi:hypothetical protein